MCILKSTVEYDDGRQCDHVIVPVAAMHKKARQTFIQRQINVC